MEKDKEYFYNELTLEDCFCLYYEQGMISEFDADNKVITIKKEI